MNKGSYMALAIDTEVFRRPEKTGQPRECIEEFAGQVSSHLGYRAGYSIFDVVERIGGSIHRVSGQALLRSLSHSLIVRSMHDFEINLESDIYLDAARMRVAHELGHLFMHYKNANFDGSDVMHAPRYDDSRADLEADWFAEAFLMPASTMRDALETGKDIFDLSQSFGVSLASAERRIHQLQSV